MTDFIKEYHSLKQKKDGIFFMNKAVENADNSDGGPFGAVIVKNNEIISNGNNKVTIENDPSAHAEIVAIRNACKKLDTFNLEGCVIYTSCEPCPMCLSACYWARLNKIYYSNTRVDAANIGFSDEFIYNELNKTDDEKTLPIVKIDNKNAIKTFQKWQENVNKVEY
jgi:tRNA(Arg) A34 adenosine deaminase TadA